MISVISIVDSHSGLENLKRNIFTLEYDAPLKINVLVVCPNKDIYLECRNCLPENTATGELLVLFCNKDIPEIIREAVELINKDEYIFILDENVILPQKVLTNLYNVYLNNRSAGFVTGVLKEIPSVFWVDDLYAFSQYKFYTDEDGIVSVDTAFPYGILTKTSLFREYGLMSDLDDFRSYSYGIRLRRSGYQNFLNTKVEYKYGGKK